MVPEARQLLTTGVPVLTTDGRRGRLHRALLSPGHCRLNALVIRYGVLPHRDVIVPVEQIADITDVQVRLRLDQAELMQLPTYQPAQHTHATVGGPGRALVALQHGRVGTSEHVIEVPFSTALAFMERSSTGLIPLHAGQPVWSGSQRVGRLEYLLLDSKGQVGQIVVRAGRIVGRLVIVPIDHMERCNAQGIWLTLDRAAFDCLTDYRIDFAIARDVRQALWADQAVSRLDRGAIGVAVDAGVVVLRGHVTTPVSRAGAERAARGVRGVLGVTNQIVADGAIQLAVAQALAHDERTRGHRLFVHVERGVVFIHGDVSSQEAHTAVETVAGSMPHVRAVINQANVPGDAGAAGDLRAHFPAIGQEVYASETRLGQVEQVIIHPRHRRVTALIVRGWKDDSQQAAWDMSLEPPRRQERQLVILASAVREVTEGAVLLHINSEAAMGYADLDPALYTPPASDWQPPYPYTHAQVLLEPLRSRAERRDVLGVWFKQTERCH